MNFEDIDFVQLTIDKNEHERIESRVKELIEIMDFSELSSSKDLEKFGISYEFVDSENFDFYELLSLNQKKEYLNTFYKSKDQKLIKEYAKTRLSRIFENAFYYSFDLNTIKKEVELLNQFTGFKWENYITELILALEFILRNDKEEINRKINVLKFLRNLFKFSNGLTLKFNYESKDYEIKSEFIIDPSTFLLIKNIPSKKLKNILKDSEIFEDDSDIINAYAYKKEIIKFNIDENFTKNLRNLRIHVIKEAEIIAQLLEPLCIWVTNYIVNFDDNQTIYSTNFSEYYFRLSRSFFTLKEFEKSIYWINHFFYTIENFKSPNCHINEMEFKNFESLRSKSLQKMKVENEKINKKSQRSPIICKSFEDARKFVRTLDLKSESEWRFYKKSGNKPIDIPSTPDRVYKDKGWIDWRDWLGEKGHVVFRDFEEAKKFVNALNLESTTSWKTYCQSENKLEDIPSSPNVVYKNKGWVDWGEWLGTGVNKFNNNPAFLDFKEAKLFVMGLRLNSVSEWRDYKKSSDKPKNIPSHPDRVYKNKGWINWRDWLGTNKLSSKSNDFRSYQESQLFVQDLDLNSEADWRKYKKTGNKPIDIPAHPDRVYKNKGWTNWREWLGAK